MKKNCDAVRIAMYINEFLCVYAKSFLTHSDHTIKSYKDALTLYILFLQEKKITPDKLSYQHFNKEWIEQWICWLKESRNCCSDTCNVRLGSLRVFLEFLGNKDIGLIYLYQNAKNIKRQKIQKKKVEGLTRNAVSAILKEPDVSTKTGKRDIVFLTVLYATAGRLDEIRSIKVGHIHLETDKPCIHLHGKGDKIRTSYLLPRAVEHIRVYLKEFHGDKPDPEAYLFYSRVGGKYGLLSEQALDKRIKLYADRARQKCNEIPDSVYAHRFRHAKASHWLEDGISIVQISFLLGHENLETTMKYLDITTEDKIKALATLENEQEKSVSKKWKNADGSLISFIGLQR